MMAFFLFFSFILIIIKSQTVSQIKTLSISGAYCARLSPNNQILAVGTYGRLSLYDVNKNYQYSSHLNFPGY